MTAAGEHAGDRPVDDGFDTATIVGIAAAFWLPIGAGAGLAGWMGTMLGCVVGIVWAVLLLFVADRVNAAVGAS